MTTPAPSPTSPFCIAKRKNANKEKKEKVLKQELLKGCRQGQNVTALTIIKRLEFKNISSQPTMMAVNTFQCPMTSPICNPFRQPCQRLL